MPSKLLVKFHRQEPDRLITRDSRETNRPNRSVTHHQVHIEGKLTGFWGALVAVALLLLFGIVFVLGLATITVVLWVACTLVLATVLRAVLRMIRGKSRRRSPPH